ncbi:MAG: dihydrofolate reductase [Lentisphaerae bacterium]|nr:dihydrofolate reductase [Lentisphaerota bacterium]MCP4100425.1 dihydrofolate reductase [Lentisphaerota bacterium]
MSRKIVLYIAVSLDGFIADDKGRVDWLSGHDDTLSPDEDYQAFIKDVDTIIMGRNTYDQIVKDLAPDNWPYEGMDCYVVTSNAGPEDANVSFVTTDVFALVDELKAKKGKKIWLLGGARLADALMKADLIDEYQIAIIPTILGRGLSLFKDNNPTLKLRLNSAKSMNGIAMLKYSKRH